MLSIPAPETPPSGVIELSCPEKGSLCDARPPAPSIPFAAALTPFALLQLLEQDRDVLVIDTRSLEAFLGDQGRVRRSIHVSFPSLLCKRFSHRVGKCIESFRLEDFITTSLGSRLYSERGNTLNGKQVVVIDDRMLQRPGVGGGEFNSGKVLLSVLDAKARQGDSGVRDLYYLDRHIGEAAKDEERLRKWVVWGENDGEQELQLPRYPIATSAALPPPPESLFSKPSTILSPRQSTNTLPETIPGPTRSSAARASLCKLDTSSSLLGPHSRPGVSSATVVSAIPSPVNVQPSEGGIFPRKAAPPRLNLSSLKLSEGGGGPSLEEESCDRNGVAPSRKMSVHELCHQQAKSPSATTTRFRQSDLDSPAPLSPVDHLATDPLPPFVPSTILPGFLYLGQEPTLPTDFAQLDALGVTEILNLAVECPPLDETSDARRKFVEKYHYLPLRDSIEETGVREVLDKSCEILDDAELRGRRIYVHCQAGKSRSCTIVLAHLIRARHWPLKKAYNHVAERRDGISPNLGFMAELMSFEERVHARRASYGVPPSTSIHRSKSVLVQPTRTSRLLLPSSPTSPNGSNEEPRSATTSVVGPARGANRKLERGLSDLGPSASLKDTARVEVRSRAVRELLAEGLKAE